MQTDTSQTRANFVVVVVVGSILWPVGSILRPVGSILRPVGSILRPVGTPRTTLQPHNPDNLNVAGAGWASYKGGPNRIQAPSSTIIRIGVIGVISEGLAMIGMGLPGLQIDPFHVPVSLP
jgi:hypothetical protein